MKKVIAKDYDELSSLAADRIAQYIRSHPDSLLCIAAGDTPIGTLQELVRLQQEGKVDLSAVYYAELDEWVGLGPDDTGSCHKVMFDAFYLPAGIPAERIHVFDGLDADTERQCRRMETWIAQHGGIGLTLLGIGLNGHVGFNEPGAPDIDGCFTVPLDDITKKVSAKYFGRPFALKCGITVGWKTLKQARFMMILASGENKADIVRRSFCGPMTANVPASLMQDHPDQELFLDAAAASKI